MKVLVITPSYKPAFVYGGPTISISELCSSLAQAGASVHVYSTTANGSRELEVPTDSLVEVDGASVIYFKRWTKDHTHFSPTLLWKVWKSCQNFDVVHIQSWWNLVSVFSVWICIIRGVKPVLSPRGVLSNFSFVHSKRGVKRIFHNWIGKYLISRTWLHATSEAEYTECIQLIPSWQGFVLPNFVQLPSLKWEDLRESDEIFRIGILSRLNPIKGMETLLQALAIVNFPFQLQIGGDGQKDYVQELKNKSRALGISDRIQWLGWINGENKFEFLRSLDLLVLTSIKENFANVVIESLYTGTAVLVSDGVGLAEFVKTNRVGWVTTLNAERIAESLKEACSKKSDRQSIRQRAPELVKGLFTGTGLASQYIKKYEELQRSGRE